jgi:hypothetical protein
MMLVNVWIRYMIARMPQLREAFAAAAIFRASLLKNLIVSRINSDCNPSPHVISPSDKHRWTCLAMKRGRSRRVEHQWSNIKITHVCAESTRPSQ